MDGRITADIKDRDSLSKKLSEFIQLLNTEDHPDELFNIANGKIAASAVNVDRAVELGLEEWTKFESSWPDNYEGKIASRCVRTMTESMKFLKVGDTKVYDTDLIYSRVIGIQMSRKIDIKEVLSYELAPVPTSMFTDSGEMRIAKAKSVLKQQLQKEVSSRQTTKDVKTLIIDGSAVLYVVHWPSNATVNDFIVNFRKYVERKLTAYDVYLVFDRYRDYSIKGITRSVRGAGSVRVHQMSSSMPLPSQKSILSEPENKQQLIALICQDLLSNVSSKHRLVVTGEEDIPMEVYKQCKNYKE
ncbi:hypothetical protein KUTeg_004634 [Tegillarca granosa]|uniref:Uncharacterized protein n=1 Tax=Tegillarca granosa TaxID=220873 RepID=A0ABQ9FKK1_TEGGR|nr:hypothetical protein KUTeg_004634 [Tegillarca granosa]